MVEDKVPCMKMVNGYLVVRGDRTVFLEGPIIDYVALEWPHPTYVVRCNPSARIVSAAIA